MSDRSSSRTTISAAAIRSLLEGLRVGDSVHIPVPGDQPFNRILYQRVNGVAYSLWGPRKYRLMSGRKEVGVLRYAL